MQNSARRWRLPGWVILALIIITALAASLRFFQIGRLPPGLSYDEAWNDLEALRIVQRGAVPVYIVDERGEGEEPLHIWLIAALYTLSGPQALGGRLICAFLGMLNVAVLFFATRELLHGLHGPPSTEKGKDVVALAAAFVLATLYWHVHYTRLGMEPPTVPALATLAFWLLWRAFNRGDWLGYALAGVALGISLYTHISARFLPVVVVLSVLWRWSADRRLIRRELPRLALFVVCALVAFAPLGFFFMENPDLFIYRAEQTSAMAFGGSVAQTFDNTIKVVGGLFWRGDTNLRLNLPGRPGLDAVQSLLFLAGVIYALQPERRRVLMFPLIWAGVMVLPSVFSDAAPHFGRMLGATPALAILVALGLAQISSLRFPVSNLKSATRQWTQAERLVLAAALVAPLYSAVRMTRDYFVTWARDPGLYTAFDVGLRQSAEYLAALPGDELISLSPVDRDLPIFRFTFRDDVSRLKTFNGRRCVVYPLQPVHDWTHVAITAQEANSLPATQRAFPSGQVAQKFFDASTAFAVAYRVKAGTRAQTSQQELAVFGDQIALVDAQTPEASVRAGQTLPITLTWTSRAPLETGYTIFVHLAPMLDAPPVAQEDAQPCDNSYPTTWWSPGEIIQEGRRIAIPTDTPPGQYILTTGIYDLATGQRLPVRSPDPSPSDRFILGTVTVAR